MQPNPNPNPNPDPDLDPNPDSNTNTSRSPNPGPDPEQARSSDPNSAGSQFFVCLGDLTNLDNKYTAMWKPRPVWPASAAQAADWPGLWPEHGAACGVIWR